jgi:hypothetical protein
MPVVQIFTIQNSAVIAGTRDKRLKSFRPSMLSEFIGIHHSLALQKQVSCQLPMCPQRMILHIVITKAFDNWATRETYRKFKECVVVRSLLAQNLEFSTRG